MREEKIWEGPGKGNNIFSFCSLAGWQKTSLYPGEYIGLKMILRYIIKLLNSMKHHANYHMTEKNMESTTCGP